ncbi:MAG: hypothetical protein HY866_17205 [Chloroflexi bacterium]|nr:hypothetical protein [Chloroflexota bacterium]
MGQGTNLFFNTITVIFLILTVVIGMVVLAVASGSMEAPIFAPKNTLIAPTQLVPPTLTPSPTPPAATAPEAVPTTAANQ